MKPNVPNYRIYFVDIDQATAGPWIYLYTDNEQKKRVIAYRTDRDYFFRINRTIDEINDYAAYLAVQAMS